jgi:hypothetical protein
MALLAALQLPHWLITAGALLLVVGFIGFAFRKAPTREEQQASRLLNRSGHLGNNGNGQDEGEQAVSDSDDLDAELSSLSRSELRTYLAAMEDGVLESGDPSASNIVQATRRARDRRLSEKDVPFRQLLDEEMDRLKAKVK